MRQIRAWVLPGAAIVIGAAIAAQPTVAIQGQKPFPEAFRVIGNIYWVGGEYGSYLITTPQGHILLDTGTSDMHDVIVSNVKKLGFKVEDIKIMISSHAHWDHVQGHAAMKQLTGAQVVALGGDAAALEAIPRHDRRARGSCDQRWRHRIIGRNDATRPLDARTHARRYCVDDDCAGRWKDLLRRVPRRRNPE